MRILALFLATFLTVGVPVGFAATGDAPAEVALEVASPTPGQVFTAPTAKIEVQGSASIFGGVTEIDLFLVLDTSRSLVETDPKDHRLSGAIGLVEALPERSDIQIGVVASIAKRSSSHR
jgi:hypothetical protein